MSVKLKVTGTLNIMGKIYDGTGGSARCVGMISSDGKIWDGTSGFAKCLGMVTIDGKVWDGTSAYAKCIGKAESPHINNGGAALLLCSENRRNEITS